MKYYLYEDNKDKKEEDTKNTKYYGNKKYSFVTFHFAYSLHF